jgi:dihydroxyacetone kinase phosphotransfer subunit
VVGFVFVSHSAGLAAGLRELVAAMQPEVATRAAGGMPDGSLGTSADKIHQALVELDNPDGTLVLVDLGSAVMSAEIAREWLTADQRARVTISDAPLVEGAVVAAVNAALGLSLAEVAACAQEARRLPKDVTPAPDGRA